MSDTVSRFLKECSSCTQCGTVCPFLERFGSPEDIIANRPQYSFLCTNCTACDKRCPLGISPSTALFETKKRLINEQRVPEKTARAIKGAGNFARRGHYAPFLRYDRAKTAFWPGCSLAGTSPEATGAALELLSSVLKEDVGLVLDCCFDPLYQMGDTLSVEEACNRIRDRLSGAGIETVIVGCVNCKKVFGKHMQGVDARHFVEVLPDDILKSVPEEDIYLHHPCPMYHVEGIDVKTSSILNYSMAEPVDEQKIPACCGYGGSLNNLDPGLAVKFTERVTMAAYGASIVTSCMGCKNMFLGKGTPTYHILELITGVKPKEKPVGAARKWANRLYLAQGKKKPVES